MKFKILLAALTITLFASCITNDKADLNSNKMDSAAIRSLSDSTNFTTIQWIDSIKNFDKITEGQKLEVVYHFKNTGTKPLIIASVTPGCGCTVADKPAEPIMPGKEGEIKAAFDSQGKTGQQHKNITVNANTRPTQSFILQFMVEVEKKS